MKFGKNSAQKITRAWILLKSHVGLKYNDIIEELKVSKRLILKIRKRYCEEGLDLSLNEKPRPGQPRLVTSDIEAKVTALACETPPKGRNCWTLDLLKSELENRFYVSIGRTSIQKVLKSHDLKPWKKKCGVFQSLTISTLIE
ncbi:MAG: helix-turn-helix domain-containing protein [Promethearchaeota archaeon]